MLHHFTSYKSLDPFGNKLTEQFNIPSSTVRKDAYQAGEVAYLHTHNQFHWNQAKYSSYASSPLFDIGAPNQSAALAHLFCHHLLHDCYVHNETWRFVLIIILKLNCGRVVLMFVVPYDHIAFIFSKRYKLQSASVPFYSPPERM